MDTEQIKTRAKDMVAAKLARGVTKTIRVDWDIVWPRAIKRFFTIIFKGERHV
jgi:hypothetical protein